MSLSEEFIVQVREAQQAALQALNTPTEAVYPSEQNVDITRQILVVNGVPTAQWTNAAIWLNAFVAARADGALVRRPSLREIQQRKEAADRAAGSRVGNSRSNAPEPVKKRIFDGAPEWLTDSLTQITGVGTPRAKQSTPAAPVKAVFPNLEQFRAMSPQERTKFYRSLNADQIRVFNKRITEQEHAQKYGTGPIGSVSAPRSIR